MRYSGTFLRLKKIIERKYYETREDCIEKMDAFFAYKRLTQEEYDELMDLVTQHYPLNLEKEQ